MIFSFLGAVAFLTRIPVPSPVHTRFLDLQQPARWFPLVGVLLGSLYAAAAWLLLLRLPPSVAATLVLALDALMTGALHLDGLADTADGFGGGRTREDVLRIMRDHCIGSYGASALILILLIKAAGLSSLLSSTQGLWILFVAPTFSRWSILLLSRCAPYARRAVDGPTGTGALSKSIEWSDLAIGTVLCLPLLIFAGPLRALICWCAAALSTLGVAGISRRRIGGFTGDVLGANVVLAEALQITVALLVVQK